MIKKLFFASALIISAAFAFVACSSDDDNNDNQISLAKTTWTSEVSNPDTPMSISIISEQEGYLCSSFTTTDDGKEYEYDTRLKFIYQKEGEKYRMNFKGLAVGYDGNWETIDFSGTENPMYFTVNKQAKTLSIIYKDKERSALKQTDYAPISWPESYSIPLPPVTKDDVLGNWQCQKVHLPLPFLPNWNIDITKNGDKYLASGTVEMKELLFFTEIYNITFKDANYTTENRKVIIENVADDDAKIVIMVPPFMMRGIGALMKKDLFLGGFPTPLNRLPHK